MAYRSENLTVGDLFVAKNQAALGNDGDEYFLIGGPEEIRALIDDLECLQLNIDKGAMETRRSLAWNLMQAAFEFGLIDRGDDDAPKPKEYGGATALARLLIERIRADKATIDSLKTDVVPLVRARQAIVDTLAGVFRNSENTPGQLIAALYAIREIVLKAKP